MNELEDSHCEVRQVLNLQNCDIENLFQTPEDKRTLSGSSTFKKTSTWSNNCLGGFFDDCSYAWLSCQSRLIIFDVKTGVSVSSWTFRDRITCVAQFPSLTGQVPLIIVGLDNDASRIKESSGTLCIFNCTISQVLRAIRLPAGVEKVTVLNGGAESEDYADRHINTYPIEANGIVCTAVRNLNHFMIDLQRDSWENVNNASLLVNDESNPISIYISNDENSLQSPSNDRKKHLSFNLLNKRLEKFIQFDRDDFESYPLSDNTITSAMIYSRKIGCIISGVFGRIIIWQNSGVVRWISPAIEANISISHLAILEPTDDPRPFCYLWVNYQNDLATSLSQNPIQKMYSMLFERKYSDKGANYYFNLDGEPALKFQLQLNDDSRIINLCPILRNSSQEQCESGNKRGEESILMIATGSTTYLFDLNQWYKEQMPRKISECDNVNAIIASYQTSSDPLGDSFIINCSYMPNSLREFSKTGQGSPEEFLFPNSLALEWLELHNNRIIVWLTRGVQSQILREMSMSGPIIIIQPTETYYRCLSAGLIASTNDVSNSNVDYQRESLLTLCLEQKWTTFFFKCVREWSDGSAAYLFPAFLRWGVQQASTIKLTAHRLCIPLFDQSGIGTGDAEIKILRSFAQQMECLSNVLKWISMNCENIDQQEQQQQQQRVLQRISTYLDILLWFYDVGLLPETNELDDESLPMSFNFRIPYPVDRLTAMYADRRLQYSQSEYECNSDEKTKNLFIDELIVRECPALMSQWEREGCETTQVSSSYYPPPSLQSLLRSCLTDCYYPDTNEIENKHQVIIYLLMDLVMLLQGSFPGVDQLIKYPAAFKLSPSLIKIIQAFWLLDHQDYQGFMDIITGQLVSDSDVKDWHHRLIIRTLLKNSQNKLALTYLKVRKPPLSSIDDQSVLVSLSVEFGLIQSAFHSRPPSHYNQLLNKFFHSCRDSGRLNDILLLSLDPIEENAFVKFLEEQKYDDTRLFYYLQRCRYTEATGINPMSNQSSRADDRINKSASLMMYNAYNLTLPDITRKFSSSSFLRQSLSGYTNIRSSLHPMTHCQNRVNRRDIHESVVRKAKELNHEKSRIPFISAPCMSLKLPSKTQDKNSILFLEPEKKSLRKRPLDQVTKNDNVQKNDKKGVKKRRVVQDDHDRHDEIYKKKVDISITFDTPIIKRKNQLTSSINQPIEKPQSILKTRQMLKDTSPSSSSVTSEIQSKEDKGRKPRQIRFSIGQVNDIDTQSISVNNNGTSDQKYNDNVDEFIAEKLQETFEEDEVNQGNTLNTTSKSLYQSTVLSDNSCFEISISKPRPKLRTSSANNLLRKSLNQNFFNNLQSTKLLDDSIPDISMMTNDVITSSPLESQEQKSSHLSELNTSVCASTILDSDSNFEFSPVNNKHENQNNENFTLQPTNLFASNAETQDGCQLEITQDHGVELSQEADIKLSIDEVTNDNDDEYRSLSASSEIQENVSQEQVPENQTKQNMNSEIIKNEQSLNSSLISNHNQIKSIESKLLFNEDKYMSQPILADLNQDDKVIMNNHVTTHQSANSDHKPTVSTYEEVDNDDIFESFNNSTDIENNELLTLSFHNNSTEQEIVNAVKKSAASQFFESFNITDDESSISHDESVSTINLQHPNTKDIIINKEDGSLETIPEYIVDSSTDDILLSDTLKTVTATIDQKTNNVYKKNSQNAINDTKNLSTFEKDNESKIEESSIQQLSAIVETKIESVVAKDSETLLNKSKTEQLSLHCTVKTRRSSSVAPPTVEPILKSSSLEIQRNRRASSLAAETISLSIPTISLKNDEVIKTPTKRGRPPKSSLMKEVLTSFVSCDETISDISDSSSIRRTRRGTSVQEEFSEKYTNKNNKNDNSYEIEIIRPKRTRAASVNKDKLVQDTETNDKNEKQLKRQIKRAVVSKESDYNDMKIVEMKTKKIRSASISKDILDDGENSINSRKTRSSSVAKDESAMSVRPKRKRGNSVSQVIDDIHEENIISLRQKRASSVTNDEVLTRTRKRTGSLSKKNEKKLNDSTTVKSTKGSSLSIDILNITNKDCETGNTDRRITRGRLRRGNSFLKEVIVEEVIIDDTDDTLQKNSDLLLKESMRVDLKLVQQIPDDNQKYEKTVIDTKKGIKSREIRRHKRAVSVDSSQIDVTAKTRSKNGVKVDPIQEEDESDINCKVEKKIVRKKRSISETKELKSQSIITEKPQRIKKALQKSIDNDDNVF
ncbi:hypothetical protein HCN44_004844 [Aphidius gifuensis]|uniref:ELYS-like domain-containing protein n=1 Tax=Aphidius gifuensis TaxID=684658 RepID=A0A834XUV2_APHGI|nr:protein ELYS [Aphidius gifuensis]KAF7992500.1 hypothetical protein HCN44_004844 [Aphidius gifuensis]